MPKTKADQLIDEAKAILEELDALEDRESKERTMGSMALSSYRSDRYHEAMRKFHEAYELREEENAGTE